MIDIAKILKDAPRGTKLYSPIFGEVYLQGVRDTGRAVMIDVLTRSNTEISFYSDGKFNTHYTDSEVTLFPSKNQRDWSKFQKPFKDGDIVVSTLGGIHIMQNSTTSYCYFTRFGFLDKTKTTGVRVERLATEEERGKLFQAIKENGYKWNEETKTLEKLVESNEDVDDRIVMSSIYFDRENYADEVELRLGNYEIEIRDGNTYAVFKNQETKTLEPVEPKFKVGDEIVRKNNTTVSFIITSIVDDVYYYYSNTHNSVGILQIKDQDDWDLVSDKVEPLFKVGDEIVKKNGITNSYIVQSVNGEYYGLQLPDKSGVGVLPTKDQDDWMVISSKPKFKVGDEVYNKKTDMVGTISKIYDDEKEYMVNLKKGGITFICFEHENCWDLVSDEVEPKFKVGDSIRKKGSYIAGTVVEIDKDYYYKVEYNGGGVSYVNIKSQNDWELVPTKFDVTTLKPFKSEVLVRDSTCSIWRPAIFGCIDKSACGLGHYYVLGGICWRYCIPYEGNEHLLSTTDDCADFYKN